MVYNQYFKSTVTETFGWSNKVFAVIDLPVNMNSVELLMLSLNERIFHLHAHKYMRIFRMLHSFYYFAQKFIKSCMHV